MIIRNLIVAGAVLSSLASPAHAADQRLVNHAYKADEVVRVEGRPGIQATIIFDQDEHVDNVAVGDSAAWQITPNKRANLLFVKPLSRRARTNMTVITDQRTYYFDLITAEGPAPLYALRFTYPEKPKPAEAAPAPAAPRVPDFAWKVEGKAKLAPDRVFSDGENVYLSWNSRDSVPAILITDEKGKEGPVNFAVRDGYTVIEGVPPRLILRSGKDKAIVSHLSRASAPRQPRSAPAPALSAN